MAIVLTALIFWLMPHFFRTVGFLLRVLAAALIAQVVVRFFPELLGLVPGALVLALMVGGFAIMFGCHRDQLLAVGPLSWSAKELIVNGLVTQTQDLLSNWLLLDIASVGRTVLLALIPPGVVLSIDLAGCGWRACALRRLLRGSPSARADLTLWLFSKTNATAVVAIFLSFGVGWWLPKLAHTVDTGFLRQVYSPLAQATLHLLILDFLAYVRHRLQHAWAPWWCLHAMHHSATELNVLTANRVHPLDQAFGNIVMVAGLGQRLSPRRRHHVLELVHEQVVRQTAAFRLI